MTRGARVRRHETRPKDKWRRLSVVAAVVTSVFICGCKGSPSNSAESPQQKAEAAKALALVKASDCLSCHQIDHDLVGPAWVKVAERYRGKPGMVRKVALKIRGGSMGVWGKVEMPAHLSISEADAEKIAAWILTLKPPTEEAKARTYTYKINGSSVTVDFPVFITDKERKVTKSVFRGFELFNSYCFRCHGSDATGGEFAPDLRQSLRNGMTRAQFFTVAMEGRKAKGMPAWAGFFSAQEMQAIYEYTKARSLGLVSVGRPPSEGD